jgi:hypothetical protein
MMLLYSRILSSWIILNITFYYFKFYTKGLWGPNESLVILNIPINTYQRYFLLLFYIIIKTIMININTQIVHSWVLLNVQNENKVNVSNRSIYEITLCSNFYSWFDWFCNLILLFSQLDIILFTLFIDFIANVLITRYYLKLKQNEYTLVIELN